MPPKKDNRPEPKDQIYRAYPIPDPSNNDAPPPQPRVYHGYNEFVKGHLGLDADRLNNAMDVVSEQFRQGGEFHGLSVATNQMRKMAPLCTGLWSLNCYKDESGANENHTFYCCVGITKDNEKSLLGLAVAGPESVDNWNYFLANLRKWHSDVIDKVTFITDGRSELRQALRLQVPKNAHVVCLNHARAEEGDDDDDNSLERLNSGFCENSCSSEVDNHSRPLAIGVFRTTERQREVAIRNGVDDGSDRVSENQFRMSMEVINENMNRRSVKPSRPKWTSGG